jgi:hypothetical protein
MDGGTDRRSERHAHAVLQAAVTAEHLGHVATDAAPDVGAASLCVTELLCEAITMAIFGIDKTKYIV